MRTVRSLARHPRGLLVALIVLIWLATLPRLVAGAFGDHGTFLSVAERLRGGDRLYADVWDNKDPLFYYALALARSVTAYGDVLLEIGWLGLAALATVSIAVSVGVSRRRAVLAGWALAPIVLTGTTYAAGMTHLPGAAVVLAVVAVSLRRRWLVAGGLLASLAFLKLTAAPLAAAAVLVMVLCRREWGGLWRLGVAAVATGGAIVALLALRGELAAYLHTQSGNVGYSQGDLLDSQWGPLAAHLLSAAPEDGRTAALTTVTALLAVTLAASHPARRPAGTPIAMVAGAMLAAALAVLATTALWPHHVQLLYGPGVVGLVALLAAVPEGWLAHARAVVAVVLVAYVIGGAAHPYWYLTAAREVRDHALSLGGVSREAAALKGLPPGSYARLGTNDTTAHARGLDEWHLACERFHQYPFDPPQVLREVLGCLPQADVVLVDRSFGSEPGQPEWDRFIEEAHVVLAERFRCSSTDFGELCLNLEIAATAPTPRG